MRDTTADDEPSRGVNPDNLLDPAIAAHFDKARFATTAKARKAALKAASELSAQRRAAKVAGDRSEKAVER